MNQAPAAEDFPLRVVAFLAAVVGLGTPFVRWVAGYLREARLREHKNWLETKEGRDCMEAMFQASIEEKHGKRYLHHYLDEWLREWFKTEMKEHERQINEKNNQMD